MRPRRLVLVGLIVIAVAMLFLARPLVSFVDQDTCLDGGGSYRPDGSCNHDPNDTVNNGPWPGR